MALVGRRSRRRRGRLAIDGVRLHDLRARSIGIEEICLPLAIDSQMSLDRPAVYLVVGVGLESSYARCDLGHLQTKVVRAASLGWIGRVFEQHEFQIVLSIGHLEIHPGKHRSRTAAPPRFL